MLFLQICLFAAYESCFEAVFTHQGAMWMILIAAAFGLRLLAVFAGIALKSAPDAAEALSLISN